MKEDRQMIKFLTFLAGKTESLCMFFLSLKVKINKKIAAKIHKKLGFYHGERILIANHIYFYKGMKGTVDGVEIIAYLPDKDCNMTTTEMAIHISVEDIFKYTESY